MVGFTWILEESGVFCYGAQAHRFETKPMLKLVSLRSVVEILIVLVPRTGSFYSIIN